MVYIYNEKLQNKTNLFLFNRYSLMLLNYLTITICILTLFDITFDFILTGSLSYNHIYIVTL